MGDFLINAIPAFITCATLAWCFARRHPKPSEPVPEPSPRPSSAYRVPFAASGQEPTADIGEALQVGAAVERARVLTIVCAVRAASGDSAVWRACDAIRDAVKAGPR